MMKPRNIQSNNNYTVQQIDDNIKLLMNLSNMSRLKDIKLERSFSEEFFKSIKHYLTIKNN